jgi:glycine cleavage system H protein
MIPDDLLYTEQHEWLRVEGDVAVAGITHHAQEKLGDITFIDLPAIGDALSQGGEACEVESAKAASSIYSPASGEVLAVNEELTDHPEYLNEEPYGKGWIFKVKLADTGQLAKLLSPADYAPLTEE